MFSGDELFGQNQQKVNKIDKVEVMGRHKIHVINDTLFQVNTISREMIDQIAGNTLADVLNQHLNITIVPNAATGRSTISMFGLSGGYVKILVDNVPMVNDNGYGNNIDVTQINLDEVDHIEIAEGSMGVLYGDNAVAGVINIITKKRVPFGQFDISAVMQEEAVGGEYNLKNTKGRHIQGVSIAHNINERWFVKTGISRNDFKGFFNDYKGKNHVGIEGKSIISDGLRGYLWNPKSSLSSYGLLGYRRKRYDIYYKYNAYHEDLMSYGHIINTRYQKDALGDYINVTANDANYLTNRFEHQLQLNGSFKNETHYQVIASYSMQKRRYKQLLYSINDRRIQNTLKDITNQSSKLFFSKGLLDNIFPKSTFFNLTAGYEVVSQKGYDIIASGAYADEGHKVVEEGLNNYDVFTQADFRLNRKLHFYPGVRLNSNSNYDAHVIWGGTIDYRPADQLDIKAVLGSAYKTPSFRQLYFYMKDANHDIQGNKDLDPEDGISIMLSASKKFTLGNGRFNHLTTDVKGFHFNIKDRIDLITTSDKSGSSDVFRYKNINNYKVLGVSLENQLNYNNINFGFGINYTGIAQSLYRNDSAKDRSDDSADAQQDISNDYFFTLNLNAFVDYFIPFIDSSIAAQYKYNGRVQQYISLGIGEEEGKYEKGEQDAYQWLDLSVRKDFFNHALEVTAGARNLFDVIRVDTQLAKGGAHSPDPTSILLGYGRSYFVKLKYHLNF